MKTTLAFLCGGISSEDYLSRRSCELLYKEMERNTSDIFVLDWQRDGRVFESAINAPFTQNRVHPSIVHCFTDFQGDIVVNLLHGEKENCGEIQGLLRLAQIPYTGNDLSSSIIGMNKTLTKTCFQKLRINSPRDFLFQPVRKEDHLDLLFEFHSTGLQFPLILKPVKGGSSFGIHLVHNKDELLNFVETTYDGTPYLFEEFIQGDDCCIGVFATRANPTPIILPMARIHYKGDFFDATIKYEDTYRVNFPIDVDKSLVEGMRDAALMTHRFIGFNGFSRCDFIVKDDEFFALEVNTHPGMSAYSIVPNMVKHAGLSLGSFFYEMIEETLGNL
jgi:D-alanine-D-alanine ligase